MPRPLAAPDPAGRLSGRLLSWFDAHCRDLPWRADRDPYRIWLAEVMLQQTQAERAAAYFTRFTARFPDAASLAAAHEDEVLALWEGLGYYSRARNAMRAARIMVAEHGGAPPRDRAALLALPGVGPYTAGAVRSQAWDEPDAAVDANAERVLARLFDLDAPVKETASRKRLKTWAHGLLPPSRPGDFNQALMELGALVCTPRTPDCRACPLADHCEALRLDIVSERPVPGKSRPVTPVVMATGVLAWQGRLLIQKRPPRGVWAGLWEFPGGRVEPGETPGQAVVREFMEETGLDVRVARPLPVVRHGYTTYSVALHGFLVEPRGREPGQVRLTAATEHRFAAPSDLAGLAFPAGMRKLMDAMRADADLAARFPNLPPGPMAQTKP